MQVDFVTFIIQSYFDTLALRVICDSLWSSCFASYGPKDTPVKPVARGYKMLRDFAGHQEHGLLRTRAHKSSDWKQFARHSSSLLGGIRLSPKHSRRVNLAVL